MQYCEAGSYACSGIKNWTTPGWAITGFNASSGASGYERAVFAACTSDECAQAKTPETLSGAAWEVNATAWKLSL